MYNYSSSLRFLRPQRFVALTVKHAMGAEIIRKTPTIFAASAVDIFTTFLVINCIFCKFEISNSESQNIRTSSS